MRSVASEPYKRACKALDHVDVVACVPIRDADGELT